jgi:hypothetical protein
MYNPATQVQVPMDADLGSYYFKNKSVYGLPLPHSSKKILGILTWQKQKLHSKNLICGFPCLAIQGGEFSYQVKEVTSGYDLHVFYWQLLVRS